MKEHVIINRDRTVVVPESLKKIGIQFDHNVNTITFDCPRYPDEDSSIDMSQMPIFINYMLPDKTPGSSLALNVVVDETDDTLMHFDWKITNAITPVNGVLSTLICVKQSDADGNELYHWNTDLFQKFTVGNGMECNGQVAEMNPDVITQLLARMGEVDTRTSAEAMSGYVNEYMTENPPQPTDEQVGSGVNTYMASNGQTHVDAYMTENQELVQNSVDDYLGRNPLQLDESLTDSTKAAPADKVGELKGDLADIDNSMRKISSNLFDDGFNGNINGIDYVKGIASNHRFDSAGNIISYEGNTMSYPIPVVGGKTYYTYRVNDSSILVRSATSRRAFFDSEYRYITGSYASAQNTHEAPINAKYVMFTAEIPSYQCFGTNVKTVLSEKDNLTEYVQYVNELVNVVDLENQIGVKDVEKVKEFSALFSNADKTESFLFFTDPHLMGLSGTYDNEKFNQYIDKLKSVYKVSPCDFIMCGGDWLNNGDTKAQACYKLGLINGTMKDLFSNSYQMVGNHDTNYQGYEYVQDNTKYRDCMLTNGAISSVMGFPTNKTYYSFDGRNCKCYVLDTGIDWWDWITDDRKAQMDWLAEQLKKDNPNHAIIFMHIICNASGVLSENAKGIEKMIVAFNNHTQTEPINGVYYDFTGTTGHIDLVMGGHTHSDLNITIGGITAIITTNFTNNNVPTFDMVLVDYDNSVVNLVRVGSGESRTVTLN